MARSPLAGQGEHAPLSSVPANARRERSRSPFGSAVKAVSHVPAWRGEVNRNRWMRATSGRAERANLRVPRGVRLRSPAHRMGRRPPPPGRGGGGVRPVAPASKPEPQSRASTRRHTTAADSPRRRGHRRADTPAPQRYRAHRRTPTARRSLDGGSDQCSEAGSLVIAKRVAFDVPRVQSHRKLARQRRLSAASAADHHDPLRIGRAGTGRAVMPVTVRREGRVEAVTAIGAPGLHFHDLHHTGNQPAADTGAACAI